MHGNARMAKSKSQKPELIIVREPNGKPQRSSDDREFPPTQVKRLRDAAMRGMADAEWGTVCGRLFLEGRLPASAYAAAKWWAERVVKYHSAINAPPPNPRAITIGGSSGGEPPDPDSFEGRLRTKREQKAVTDFMEAHCVLVSAGKLAEHCVRSVCENNYTPCGTLEYEALERGLLWLADHRGLTKQQKNDVR